MSTEFDRGWEFLDEEQPGTEEPSSTETGPPEEASEDVGEASWDDDEGQSAEDIGLADGPSWQEQIPVAPSDRHPATTSWRPLPNPRTAGSPPPQGCR